MIHTRLLPAFLAILTLNLWPFFGLQAGLCPATMRILSKAHEPGSSFFIPPESWEVVDPALVPKNIRLLVKSPEKNKYPPSINLASDRVNCDLKTYLKKVKAVNEADGIAWKDLGTIDTLAGKASLSQIDMDSSWGPVRMMHTILIQDGQASILTCAALKKDFPKLYDTFFGAMKSLRINAGWVEQVPSREKQERLSGACGALKEACQALCQNRELPIDKVFESGEFQEKHWKPFSHSLEEEFADMDPCWHEGIRHYARTQATGLN